MEMVVACAALPGSPGMLMGQHRPLPAASQTLVLSGNVIADIRVVHTAGSTLGCTTGKGAAAADPPYS